MRWAKIKLSIAAIGVLALALAAAMVALAGPGQSALKLADDSGPAHQGTYKVVSHFAPDSASPGDSVRLQIDAYQADESDPQGLFAVRGISGLEFTGHGASSKCRVSKNGNVVACQENTSHTTKSDHFTFTVKHDTPAGDLTVQVGALSGKHSGDPASKNHGAKTTATLTVEGATTPPPSAPQDTTTTLAQSGETSAPGDDVTFTSTTKTESGPVTSGSVDFSIAVQKPDGNYTKFRTPKSKCQDVMVNDSGQAKCTVTAPTRIHRSYTVQVKATYSDGDTDADSTSEPVTHTVSGSGAGTAPPTGGTATTTHLTQSNKATVISVGSVVPGEITFTSKTTAGSGPVDTGSVHFTAHGTRRFTGAETSTVPIPRCKSVSVNDNGVATCTVAPPYFLSLVKNFKVTATYSDGDTYAGSSDSVNHFVVVHLIHHTPNP
jgi:hypothetical protein